MIAATNKDLEEEIAAGRFREDLFYRLNVVPIEVPPLRSRRDDIPLLVEKFTGDLARYGGVKTKTFDDDALDALRAREWPGNVRELRNVIERAMIFAEGDVLEPHHLPPFEAVAVTATGGGQGMEGGFPIPKGLTLAGAEKEYIRHTLAAFDGSIQRAAEALGISRKSLWEKRKKYGLLE